MTINDLYFLSVISNKEFKFNENNNISFVCPHCKQHLIKYSLQNNKPSLECEQKYLYLDGDSIDCPEEYWSKLDSFMVFGKCEKCGLQIANISADVIDKNIDGFIGECPSLGINNGDFLIKSFDNIKQYEILLDNIIVGYMLFYKNALLDKNSMICISQDNVRDICRIDLSCLAENIDMDCCNMGVCNGHFENTKQADIWHMATKITSNLYITAELFLKVVNT